MTKIVLPATNACACAPEHLKLGPHYVGETAVESAILDLTQFESPHGATVKARLAHEKSIDYSLRRAYREGYRVRQFGGTKRNPEIEAINTSAAIRQGRPMAASYATKMVATPGDTDLPRERACPQHYRTMYGCFSKDDVLVAYISFVRSGPLGIFSRILAHAGHWKNGVMHATVGVTLIAAHADGTKWILYGAHRDGQLGLQAFKRRWGFEPRRMVLG